MLLSTYVVVTLERQLVSWSIIESDEMLPQCQNCLNRTNPKMITCQIDSSRHSCVSAAKKAMWCISVLFTRTTNLLFSTTRISKPLDWFLSNLQFLCPPYMQPYIPILKKISIVVHEICVPENCPVFSTFFFFTPFYKSNFEPTKDTLLINWFLSSLSHL